MHDYHRNIIQLTDLGGPKAILSLASAHIHAVDLPYRLASTWQDLGCELGTWERGTDLLAWAVFQPPWYNLDFFFHPGEHDPGLLEEVLRWGIEQMKSYAQRIRGDLYGLRFLLISDFPFRNWFRFDEGLQHSIARPPGSRQTCQP
jgi:hypothetical protein